MLDIVTCGFGLLLFFFPLSPVCVSFFGFSPLHQMTRLKRCHRAKTTHSTTSINNVNTLKYSRMDRQQQPIRPLPRRARCAISHRVLGRDAPRM